MVEKLINFLFDLVGLKIWVLFKNIGCVIEVWGVIFVFMLIM